MNPYNSVRYATYAKSQTHPDHLAALATIFGLQPAPATRCRVLDIGCGTGDNLIAMAVGLPDSEFLGVDLASDPIEEGRRMIGELGLRNIQLRAMDIMDFTPEFGRFDYIVAFGVFSWVPPEVSRKMLALSAAHLAPQGVTFMSYNVYPGFHLRALVRDMLLYQIKGVADPADAIQQAQWLMHFLMEVRGAEDEYGACLHGELEKALQRPPGGFFHDDLAPFNTALYFHEFAAMAREHGLQYLAEAEYFTMQEHLYGEKVVEALRPFAGDIIRKEQYLDFIRGRRFRQTLLCHAGLPIEREVRAERMRGLRFSCPARPDAEGRFQRAVGVPVRPVHPLARAALVQLSDAYPRRLSFPDLLHSCGVESDAANLSEILLGCYSAGLIDAHLHAPHFAAQPGARPVASPLARMQLRDENVAVNLCHNLVKIEEETGRRLVQLLDGTHDRLQLASELGISEEALGNYLRDIARLALLLE